jgi:hypothetical protein
MFNQRVDRRAQNQAVLLNHLLVSIKCDALNDPHLNLSTTRLPSNDEFRISGLGQRVK